MTQVLHRHAEVEQMVLYLLSRDRPVAFDIETTGLNPRKDKVVMMQFSVEGGQTFILDTRPLVMLPLGKLLRPLFNQALILGMNITFDLGMLLQQCHVEVKRVWDVMLADLDIHGVGLSEAHLSGLSFDLASIARRYGNDGIHKEERSWFIDLDQRPEWYRPFPQEQIEYGAQDVESLFSIYRQQQEKVTRLKLGETINLDMSNIPPVVGMQTVGVPVDEQAWRNVITRAANQAQVLESELQDVLSEPYYAVRLAEYDAQYATWKAHQEAREATHQAVRAEFFEKHPDGKGWGDYKKHHMALWNAAHPAPTKPKEPPPLISVTSHQQVKEALNALGLRNLAGDVIQFHSIKEAMLVEYSYHPVVEKLLEWKKLSKLVVGFGDGLMAMVEQGRLYPHYNITGAGTGRMSSYKPNFQQVPSRTELGQQLRAAIRPLPGRKLVACDFSNIELRILADMAKDTALLAAFASGDDVHSAMARMIFKLDKSVDPKKTLAVVNGKTLDTNYRNISKTVTYAVLYGAGPSKLASVIKGTVEEAKGIIDDYFRMFKGVKAFKDRQAERAMTAIYEGKKLVSSRTIGGRRRPNYTPKKPVMPPGRSTQEVRDAYDAAMLEYRKTISSIKRKMVNSPIQGTSADITKYALYLWHERYGYDDGMQLIAVVHDELLLEVDDDRTEEAATAVAEVMHDAMLHYLHRVDCPMPEAVVSDHWEH